MLEDDEEPNECDKTVIEFVKFMEQLPANRLGNLIAEYVNESAHSGWEGYDPVSDMPSIAAMLQDIMTYYQQVNDPSHFDKPGFGGVTYFTKPTND